MQNISIFVSSTFKDMMCERDILRRYVWPELSNYYNPKGIDVQLIDLRWGVVAEDNDSEASEKKILKCCIDTIDVCKPFIIGFLGHRYGWIPPKDDMSCLDKQVKTHPLSVTHIEIDYGIIQNNNYSRSLIFKRSTESYKNVPTVRKKIYIDDDKELVDYASHQFDKIRDGYKRANATANIINYTLDINQPSKGEIYKFAQLVINNLRRVIDEEIDKNTDYSQKHTCDLFLKNYIPNLELFNTIINNTTLGKHSLIYGGHGTGKTSFAVYLYRMFKHLSESVNCFLFSTDFSLGDRFSIQETIMTWSENLSHVKFDPMNTVIEEWKRFKYLHYQQTNPTIVIIDGYDRIREIKDSNVFMVPTKGIVYIVISSMPLPKWEMRFQVEPNRISNLSQEDANYLINNILKSNKKDIPTYVYDAIFKYRKNENDTYNPLDLTVLLSYILSLDKEDYDKIDKIHNTSQEKALYEHIVSIIKEMPTNGIDRSNYVLHRMKLLFDIEQLYPLLYTSYSLNGLSESDFMELIPDYDTISFYLIRNYLKPYLPSNLSDGRWHIINTDIEESIKTAICNQKEQTIYYNLSKLQSISEDEKFYYAIYGNNDQLVYELYSCKDESKGVLDYKQNSILSSFFEDENNIIWFLSILVSGNPQKNEIIISNLLFSFYSHFSRQNPQVNSLKLLFLLSSKIESGEIPLTDKTDYYLGIIYDSIGRHIINRNIDESVKQIGINHLKKALHYYNLYGEADFAKQETEKYLETLYK